MLNDPMGTTERIPYSYTSEEFKILIDLLPVGVSILDSERHIVAMNKALETILGFSREQLLNGAYKNRRYLNADDTEISPDDFPSTQAIKAQKQLLILKLRL